MGAACTAAFVLWGDRWDPYGANIGLGLVFLCGLLLFMLGALGTVRRPQSDDGPVPPT